MLKHHDQNNSAETHCFSLWVSLPQSHFSFFFFAQIVTDSPHPRHTHTHTLSKKSINISQSRLWFQPGLKLLCLWRSQNLLCTFFFTECVKTIRSNEFCENMSCSHVFHAVVSVPSINAESMQISNRVMNLRYQMRPSVFSLWQRAHPWWGLQLNLPLKFTVGIASGCLWVPWHSANTPVLFQPQLMARWWWHCHLGWHGSE